MLPLGYYYPAPGLWVKNYFPITYMVWSMLFLSAYTLATGAILNAFKCLRSLALIMALGYVVAPLLAYTAMLLFFGPESDYRIGLLLASAAPSTLASSIIWTRLGKGNDALALAGTMFMNLTGFLTAPLILQVTLSQQVQLNPVAMAENLLFTLLLPVAAGQIARAVNTDVAKRLKKPASTLNQVITLLLVLTAISRAAQEAGKKNVTAGDILLVVFAVGVVHLLTLIVGWYGGRTIGIPRADRIAVSITGSQKTLAVGTYIAETFFPAYPFAVLPIMFYHATQLVTDSLIVDVWKKKAGDTEVSSLASTCPRADACSSGDVPKDTA